MMSAIDLVNDILTLKAERDAYKADAERLNILLAGVLLTTGGRQALTTFPALGEALRAEKLMFLFGGNVELVRREGIHYLPITSREEVEAMMKEEL